MNPLCNLLAFSTLLFFPNLHAQIALAPYAEIKDKDIDESSGIVKSRQFETSDDFVSCGFVGRIEMV